MTTLRKAEYNELSKLSLSGNIIDLGGTKNADYYTLFKGSFSVTVANSSKETCPDVLCDFERPLPFGNAVFDGALMINVLEHIFEYRSFLNEVARILAPGGKVIIVVPYLFPYHASPEDFHRYSASALQRALIAAGFSRSVATPLGSGVWSARWQLIERLLPRPLQVLSVLCDPLARGADFLFTALARMLDKKYNPADYALGFIVTAVRE